jgi:hypothetical protein
MGGGEREGRDPPPEGPLGDCGFGLLRIEIGGEHAFDLGGAHPSFQALDGPSALQEDERRDLGDAEPVGPFGRRGDVDSGDPQAFSLLAGEVGEEALHPPGGPGRLLGEKEQCGSGGGLRQSAPDLVLEGFPCG